MISLFGSLMLWTVKQLAAEPEPSATNPRPKSHDPLYRSVSEPLPRYPLPRKRPATST